MRVAVEGDVVKDSAIKVEPDTVTIDGEPLDHPDGILVLLNKPIGLVCSHDEREGPSIYGLFPGRWRRRNPVITPVGPPHKDNSRPPLPPDPRIKPKTSKR